MSITAKKDEILNYFLYLSQNSKIRYWAEKELGWSVLRDEETNLEAWYQYVLLGCFDNLYKYPEDYHDVNLRGKLINKFAWRIGRQCLPEGSIIHTRDGQLVPIEEHPDAWLTKQSDEIYNIELEGGYSVRCTAEHNIPVFRNGEEQKLQAKDIIIGDELETLVEWNKWGNGLVPYKYNQLIAAGESNNGNWRKEEEISGIYEINNELAELLGYLVTDGNAAYSVLNNSTINFTNSNINYLKRVEELINNQFPDINVNWYKKPIILKKDKTDNQKEAYVLSFYSKEGKGKSRGKNKLREFLKAMDFHPCKFPRAVAKYFTKEQVCAFLRGAWAGDGCFYYDTKNYKIEGCFAGGLSRTYVEFYHALFAKLGILFKIESQTMTKSTSPFWKLRFRNATAAIKFKEVIGDILDKDLTFNFKRKLAKRFTEKKIHNQIDNEVMTFSKVKKITIEKVESVNCYDVEYPDKGWFLSGNTRLFNSGKTDTLSVGALYLALERPVKWTKPRRYKDASLIGTLKPDGSINETGWTETLDVFWRGAKTIVGSADADKARTIFDRVMKYINQSEKLSAALENGIIEKKLHPFPELIFHVEGWTEPASITFRGPGAGGQTARSKTFDYKLYDEADYMPPIFFEAEKATSINAGDNGLVILSSTPTGKRAHFYNACFPAGTPILMSDKTFKPIEEIKIGDMVINRYGDIEPVTNVMNRDYNSRIVSFLTSFDDTIISATLTHRFMSYQKSERFCPMCYKFIWDNETPCPVYGTHAGFKRLKPKYNKIRNLQVGDFLAISLKSLKNIKDAKNIKGKIKGKYLYVPITDYLTEYINQPVYNLTVGKDHSYTVHYYGVSNCTKPDLNYFEFHVPSKENPRYTVQFDKEFLKEHPRTVYEHEINAEWGTVEEGVFDWTYFEWVFRMYEEVLTKDGSKTIKKPIYRIFNTESHKKRKRYPDEYEKISLTATDIEKIGHINLGMWLKTRIPPKTPNKRYWFGADLGYQADPSEFVVFEEWNGVMKLILRIHMEHVKYLTQCDIIALLDNHYMFEALGMDQGGNGLSAEQLLKAKDNGYNKYKNHNFEKRLHAVNFSNKVQVSEKFSGKQVLVPVKQFMTDCIILAAQDKLLIMPSVDVDDEIENQFRNHTYSMGSGGTIIYSKSDYFPDHVIDAVRTAFFAKTMAKMPKNKAWPVGGSFRAGGGSSAWR